jgi:ABC-2 type transport system permease protein
VSSAPQVMPPGTLVRGPTALGNDRRRLLRLAWTLAATDFKLRFFGSALGYLWQLMRPLMLFAILYVVFTQIMGVTGPEKYFGVSLLLGIVLYNFFGEATGGAVKCILMREQLVRKIDFPRLAVPLSTVLQALFNLGLNLLPVLVFLLAAGGRPRLSWLALPLVIIALATMGLGLAMLLSSLYVRYRDIDPIWDVVLQALFYATPILYTISLVIDKAGQQTAQLMLLLNPFAAVVQEAKHVFVDPSHPSVSAVLDSTALTLVPLAEIAALLILGYWVFAREAPRIAEDL